MLLKKNNFSWQTKDTIHEAKIQIEHGDCKIQHYHKEANWAAGALTKRRIERTN